MLDRGIHVLGLDMLLIYDQDVLHLLVFAVKEMLAVLESEYHFHLEELIYSD
jgi:hypothetical protein